MALRNWVWLRRNASIEASRYCGTMACMLSPYSEMSWRKKLTGSIVCPRFSSSMMIWVRTVWVMSSSLLASITLKSRPSRVIWARCSSVM